MYQVLATLWPLRFIPSQKPFKARCIMSNCHAALPLTMARSSHTKDLHRPESSEKTRHAPTMKLPGHPARWSRLIERSALPGSNACLAFNRMNQVLTGENIWGTRYQCNNTTSHGRKNDNSEPLPFTMEDFDTPRESRDSIFREPLVLDDENRFWTQRGIVHQVSHSGSNGRIKSPFLSDRWSSGGRYKNVNARTS